ncbi:MAG: ATPase domain-containing protein, partial [Archaeoglobaceae archaeon]
SKEVTDRIIDYIERIENYGFGFTKELLYHGIKTEAKEQMKKGVDADRAWKNAFEMAKDVCEKIMEKMESRSLDIADNYLGSKGYHNIVRKGEIVGRSGVKHTFSLFAVDDEGKDIAVDVISEGGMRITTEDVMRFCSKKKDIDLAYMVITLSEVSEEARRYAESQGLDIMERRDIEKLLERRKILIHSGIPILDKILGGGLIKNRVYLLSGDVGTGKTTFGLHFCLEGCRHGQKSLLILTDQKPEHLIQDFEMLDFDLQYYIDRELLYLYDLTHQVEELKEKVFHGDISPIEYCERILNDLYSHIRRTGASRVVIDTFTTLLILNHPWARDIARKMIINSENLDCTILLIKDKHSEKNGLEESFVQAVIEIDFKQDEEGVNRYLTVTKARGIHSFNKIKSYKI